VYKVIREGEKRRIGWGSDPSGRYRGEKYFEELPSADQAKFEPLFERMAETGQIRNTERFRQEEKNLYVFKSFNRRLACFFDGAEVVIIDGFTKKSDKGRRSRRHVQQARALRDAYLERKKRSQR
jgi:hypothetical protein